MGLYLVLQNKMLKRLCKKLFTPHVVDDVFQFHCDMNAQDLEIIHQEQVEVVKSKHQEPPEVDEAEVGTPEVVEAEVLRSEFGHVRGRGKGPVRGKGLVRGRGRGRVSYTNRKLRLRKSVKQEDLNNPANKFEFSESDDEEWLNEEDLVSSGIQRLNLMVIVIMRV